MEDKPLPEIKKTLSTRNKEMLLVEKKYQFNLINTYKDGSKLFKCKEYKTILKCPTFIKMKGEEVIEISNEHNHIPKEDKFKRMRLEKKSKKKLSNLKIHFQ